MTKSMKTLFFGVLLLLVGLACDATGGATNTNENTSPVNPTSSSGDEILATLSAPTLSLTVSNNSSRTICSLYVTPQEATEWGEERLGTEVLTAGASVGVEATDGDYRIRANDCDGDLLAEYSEFEVNGATTLSVEDKTVSNNLAAAGEAGTVTVINNSSQDVCYVYISSTEATSWGSDWLDESTILEPGNSETITVGAGIWDMQVANCDGDALAEQYDVDFATGQTWTLE